MRNNQNGIEYFHVVFANCGDNDYQVCHRKDYFTGKNNAQYMWEDLVPLNAKKVLTAPLRWQATIAYDQTGNFGLSICSGSDNFNRKISRGIAANRLKNNWKFTNHVIRMRNNKSGIPGMAKIGQRYDTEILHQAIEKFIAENK
jgi:hypothetical protein